MDNLAKNPTTYTEMKLKVLITGIEKKLDKNQKDFWIITGFDNLVRKTFLAFASDYSIAPKTAYLLLSPHQIINQTAVLTIRKRNKDDFERVINLELEK